MRIQFDPDNSQIGGGDIPFDKNTYMTLINALTSRLPADKIDYPRLSNDILNISKIEVLKKIPPEYDDAIKTDIEHRINKYFSDANMIADNNYIGKINIVLLQCLILFTDYAMKLTHSKLRGLPPGIEVVYSTLIEDKWENYNTIIKILKYIRVKGYVGMLYPITITDKKLFIITVVDYLSITDIVESFLNNVFYCGFSSTFTKADGYDYSPFEFTVHDIIHADNLNYFIMMGSVNLEDLKNYYYYCKNTIDNKKELYKIKLFIFLQIHEGPRTVGPSYAGNKYNNNLTIFLDEEQKMTRYIKQDDLGLAFPKEIRDNKDKIKNYITEAYNLYINKFREWKMSGKPSAKSNYLTGINEKIPDILTSIGSTPIAATGGGGASSANNTTPTSTAAIYGGGVSAAIPVTGGGGVSAAIPVTGGGGASSAVSTKPIIQSYVELKRNNSSNTYRNGLSSTIAATNGGGASSASLKITNLENGKKYVGISKKPGIPGFTATYLDTTNSGGKQEFKNIKFTNGKTYGSWDLKTAFLGYHIREQTGGRRLKRKTRNRKTRRHQTRHNRSS